VKRNDSHQDSDMTHIFISYARSDGSEYAEKLDHDLQLAGYRTWRDLRSIDEYQDFSAEIELAIRDAAFVVVVVTPSIELNPRSFVRREVIYAENCGKPIIPLVFPNAGVPILLGHLTWISFCQGDKPRQTLDYERGRRKLIERLQEPTQPAQMREISDPFRDYLKALYDQILYYLNQTVFTYIPLRGQSAPDAVEGETPMRVLPMAFLSMAGIADEPETRAFESFHDAADSFDGRMLVMGEPGAGKTITLFAYARDAVARRLEDPTQPLPLLAPIATWDAQKRPGLVEWLGGLLPALKRDEIARLAEYGQLLLLLDGLDELGGEREIRREDGTIERYDPRWRFLQMLPENNQVIVTCREKDYEALAAKHGRKIRLSGAITLQPLDDAQINDYLRDIPALREAIASDAELRELARTPLLLSLLSFAYRATQDLSELNDLYRTPGTLRDKIFELFVRRSYEREARKPNTVMAFSLDEIHRVLGLVAVRNALNRHGNENIITLGNLKSALSQGAIEPFVELMMQLHLFVPIDAKSFRFVHLLLRDYFLYRYGVQQLTNPHSDSDTRRRAVKAVGKLGARVFEVMVDALRDPDAEIRAHAAETLGELADKRALSALITAAGDTDAAVRRNAVAALGLLHDPAALDTLIQALGDRDGQTQAAAAEALGELRDHRAVEALKACLTSGNSYVRSFAVKALGKLKDTALVESMLPLLKDENQFVRSAAAMALCEIRDKRAVPPVLELLDDPDKRTRRVVVYVLGLFRDARAVQPLIEALKDDDHQVRKKSALALKMIGTPEALAAAKTLEE
jgi:HEAT repeat protein